MRRAHWPPFDDVTSYHETGHGHSLNLHQRQNSIAFIIQIKLRNQNYNEIKFLACLKKLPTTHRGEMGMKELIDFQFNRQIN